MHGNPIFPLDKPCYTSRPRVDWNMIIMAYQYTIIVITCFNVSYISWYIEYIKKKGSANIIYFF